ncbi:MAG: hypothetical protein QOC78_288 [Solirubrobacteraceae bacterium]|jgi:hypothetical protein|nr:hypothetical protein [Solirubrobacteraceae bacterium]
MPRSKVALASACAAAVVGVAALAWFLTTRSTDRGAHRATPQITWRTAPGTAHIGDRAQLDRALAQRVAKAAPGSNLTVTAAVLAGHSGVVSGDLRDAGKATSPAADPVLLLIRRGAEGWTALTPADPGFCAALQHADPPVRTAGAPRFWRCP